MQSASDFLVYLNIIAKRLWLTVLLVVVTVGVILSVTLTAGPVYLATVRLQVLATDRSDVSLFTEYYSSNTIAEIQQAQNDFSRALKSGFVAWQTIADLNLEIGALDLLENLNTVIEGDFIIVTIESNDPGRAEDIANTQVTNALAYYRQVRATPSRVLGEFVEEQLASASDSMLAAESALLEFKQQNNLDSIQLETRSLQDLVRALKLERDRAVIERDRAAIFANIYRAQELEADQQADAIEESEQTSRSGEELAPYTKKYFRDQAKQHEATAIGYEAQRDGYERSLQVYDDMIAQRTKELRALLGLYDGFNALERELSRETGNYQFLRDKQNEARLKQLQAERLGYIQIVESARKPDAPARSRTVELVLVGGIVSVLVGFVLSFFLEFLSALGQAARRNRSA